MQFHQLTLDDIENARPFFYKLKSQTCDFTVGGMFMWRDFYKMECAVAGDAFHSRLRDENGNVFYNLPICENVEQGIKTLLELEGNGIDPIWFCTIPEIYIPAFRQAGEIVQMEEQRDYFDYLYNARDLVELKGKKYSGQRNLISQFERYTEDWRFEPMSEENVQAASEFFALSYPRHSAMTPAEDEENAKVLEVLENMDKYKMFGGILYANGQVAGFSLGEIINGTLYTHIEKADRSCKGAYQMLVNQFSAHFAKAGVEFINREEDMGDPGLRIAKEAYHPTALLNKYILSVK